MNQKGDQMNRVKEFRKELGISQLELAKDTGVSRQTINMIENDKYTQLWNSVSISPQPPNWPQQSLLGG